MMLAHTSWATIGASHSKKLISPPLPPLNALFTCSMWTFMLQHSQCHSAGSRQGLVSSTPPSTAHLRL